jgi:hypothetical protein
MIEVPDAFPEVSEFAPSRPQSQIGLEVRPGEALAIAASYMRLHVVQFNGESSPPRERE